MKISKLLILLAPVCLVNCGGGNNAPDPASAQTPLCITCTSENAGLLQVCQYAIEENEASNLQYSTDNKNWQNVDFFAMQWPKILHKGDTLYFRGDNQNGLNHVTFDAGGSPVSGHFITFLASDGTFDIGGNVMSLIKPEGFDTLIDIPNDYCFANLFSLNEELFPDVPSLFVDASKLTLPATNLKTGCYYQMFTYNYLLTNSPKLPASSLAEGCYTQMFEYCYSLKKVQVAFKEEIFADPIKYTESWLPLQPDNDDAPVFMWPGEIAGITRSTNTVPDNWEVQKI